jgi:hypothetical protein
MAYSITRTKRVTALWQCRHKLNFSLRMLMSVKQNSRKLLHSLLSKQTEQRHKICYNRLNLSDKYYETLCINMYTWNSISEFSKLTKFLFTVFYKKILFSVFQFLVLFISMNRFLNDQPIWPAYRQYLSNIKWSHVRF